MDNRSRSLKLGNFIKNELKQRGWIQEDLAKLMEVDGGQISKIINPKSHKYEPTIDTLEKVAKAFGMKIENLISKMSDSDEGSGCKDGNIIFGRNREVKTIEEVIASRRLVMITGLTGIGKTAIVLEVIKSFPNHLFQIFGKPTFWFSNDSYNLDKFIDHIVKNLNHTNTDKRDISFQLSRSNYQISDLLETLNRNRCLLVLDNLDLDHQEYGDSYRQLLEQIAKTPHQSCVIVTCRSLPRGYSSWEPSPEVLRLGGLKEPEANRLLDSLGISAQSDPEPLKILIQKYGGNPWGLKLAAQDILDNFRGDLTAYVKHSTHFASDLHDEIQKVIQCLSNLELEVLYWLALHKEPIYFADIRKEFPDRYKVSSRSIDIDKAIKELYRRSLLQSHDSEFYLQTEVQICVELNFLNAIQSELEEVILDVDIHQLHWLRSLELSAERMKLRDRLSRRDPELTNQAYIQLEAVSQQHPEKAIGYAISNLRYLLGKPL
jgi:transcriptional regulator with XRE-family HTH domain